MQIANSTDGFSTTKYNWTETVTEDESLQIISEALLKTKEKLKDQLSESKSELKIELNKSSSFEKEIAALKATIKLKDEECNLLKTTMKLRDEKCDLMETAMEAIKKNKQHDEEAS